MDPDGISMCIIFFVGIVTGFSLSCVYFEYRDTVEKHNDSNPS